MENPNNLEENLQVMNTELLNLDEIRSAVERKRISGMSEWMQKVKLVEGVVEEIWKDFYEIQRSYDPSNPIARRLLNQMAMKCIKEVQTLTQEGNANPGSVEWLVGSLLRNQLKNYSLIFLETSTSKFSTGNKIGAGGYGEVFKGQFPGGEQVAVKVLTEKDVDGEVFMTELNTMAKAHHVNLIKLYGFCSEGSKKALVYEYMENGSLDRILYAKNHDVEWGKLFKIAIGTARAIAYLHDGCEERIIHHDIKPANVLLDKNMSPKVTDFGVARLLKGGVSHITNIGNRGTFGFSAPEMFTPYEPVTEKCDVYSFGMMLFEILGKRSNTMGTKWFPGHVWELFQAQGVEAVLKECKIMDDDRGNATLLVKVALHCVQFTPRIRPSMSNVVKMLENLVEVGLPQNPFLPSAGPSVHTSKQQSAYLKTGLASLPENGFSHRKDASMQDQPFRIMSTEEILKSIAVKMMMPCYNFPSSSSIQKSIQNERTKLFHIINHPKELTFEENFSSSGVEAVVLYTMTLEAIRKEYDECNDIRIKMGLLEAKVSERDISILNSYREELKKIQGSVVVDSVVWIKGRLIAEKVMKKMKKEGQFRIIFDGEHV